LFNVVADEAEKVRRQSAHHSLGSQFLQALDGKDDADMIDYFILNGRAPRRCFNLEPQAQ
jgi:hypothetical protein